MMNIKLELSIENINIILNSLGNMPYNKVVELINNITIQSKTQIENEEKAQEKIKK